MALTITHAVGTGGINHPDDVRVVQTLLNNNLYRLTHLTSLAVDGLIGPATIGAIDEFQRRVLGFAHPDGRVDPNGKTLAELQNFETFSPAQGITDADYAQTAKLLGVDVATVESRREGFLDNGEPKALFEGHWEVKHQYPVFKSETHPGKAEEINAKITEQLEQYQCPDKGDETFNAEVATQAEGELVVTYEAMWLCPSMPRPDSTEGELIFELP